jgi:hopanoid biosynthesis associated radical SAM protein HpnH
MRFPIQLNASLTAYLMKKKMAGVERFPLVLMLEPLHKCNLACVGCGRIREYKDTLADTMTLKQCLDAVVECGAPVVSICGGEPLLYPQIGELVQGVLDLKRNIYLCTNAIELERSLDKFKPSQRLNLNFSVDGLAENQDASRNRKGIFELQIKAMKEAKRRGFRVVVNTTLYKESDVLEIEKLFDLLTEIGVDGIEVTPGFSYDAVGKDIFLDRKQTHEKFRHIAKIAHKYRLFNTPLYMKFLAGERHLDCTPWGNVTVGPQGWKGPCYLITDRHYKSYNELMHSTDWDRYVKRDDPRCANCMVHSGCEATAVREVGKSLGDIIDIVKWNLA